MKISAVLLSYTVSIVFLMAAAMPAEVFAQASPNHTALVSPNPTVNNSCGCIKDNSGNTWTLVKSAAPNNQQIALNGTIDASTANVKLLVWDGGVIHQMASQWNFWWKWDTTQTPPAWVFETFPKRRDGCMAVPHVNGFTC